jgi:hydrogenase expression/formation protein HypE
MTQPGIPAGKVPAPLLARLLSSLPARPASVELGPALGEDACAIDIGEGVLVVAADPITLTGSNVGRFAVTVNANDLAVTGARPQWFLATLLFPPGTTELQVTEVFDGIRDALQATGAILVGGHSEITAAVRTPVVAGTMLGLAERGRCVRTSGAGPGDVLVQIGTAPVEGAAVLAVEAGPRLGTVEPGLLAAAVAAVDDPGISVVDAALLAAELGATAMHDPTEGGIASGLHEMASAANVALHVERDAMRWFAPGLAVCAALGADPWATLASGCALATFPHADARAATAALAAAGFDVSIIGTARTGSGVFDEHGAPIERPERDEVARILG